jgi:phospholipid/cholesterol/gamma-HCH transport system substrate-binding protein
MERKANYVLIGLFTFAVVAGAFGFVFWIHHTAGKKQSVLYRVIFDTSLSGLRRGAPVLINGITEPFLDVTLGLADAGIISAQ